MGSTMRSKQCEPPIEDEVVQIDVGDQEHPRPIFISNSLSLEERQNLISLIRDYIDVFAGAKKICRV